MLIDTFFDMTEVSCLIAIPNLFYENDCTANRQRQCNTLDNGKRMNITNYIDNMSSAVQYNFCSTQGIQSMELNATIRM